MIRQARAPLPQVWLETEEGESVEPSAASDDRVDYRFAAKGQLTLKWEDTREKEGSAAYAGRSGDGAWAGSTR